jgi:hypothetical protein
MERGCVRGKEPAQRNIMPKALPSPGTRLRVELIEDKPSSADCRTICRCPWQIYRRFSEVSFEECAGPIGEL